MGLGGQDRIAIFWELAIFETQAGGKCAKGAGAGEKSHLQTNLGAAIFEAQAGGKSGGKRRITQDCGEEAEGDSGHWSMGNPCPRYNHPDDNNASFDTLRPLNGFGDEGIDFTNNPQRNDRLLQDGDDMAELHDRFREELASRWDRDSRLPVIVGTSQLAILRLSLVTHPDKGGKHEDFIAIKAAHDAIIGSAPDTTSTSRANASTRTSTRSSAKRKNYTYYYEPGDDDEDDEGDINADAAEGPSTKKKKRYDPGDAEFDPGAKSGERWTPYQDKSVVDEEDPGASWVVEMEDGKVVSEEDHNAICNCKLEEGSSHSRVRGETSLSSEEEDKEEEEEEEEEVLTDSNSDTSSDSGYESE
ncbi:hypothetical protein Q7P37_006121 [Cladosporium fusiforme]